jgi:hypothetical protein
MKRISGLIRRLLHIAGQHFMPLWAEIFLSFRLATPPGSFRFRPAKPTSPTSKATNSVGARQSPNPSLPPPPLDPQAEDSPSAAPASSMRCEKARRPALPAAAGAGDADLHGRHDRGHPLRGLRPHEVWLLRLLDKISDHHTIDLNETGKALPPAPPPPRA